VFYDLQRATFYTLFLAMGKRIVYFIRNLKLKNHGFTNTFLQLDPKGGKQGTSNNDEQKEIEE
jgi:hypothetical protein